MRRKDLFEFKQFSIHQGHAGMKVGTDSDLLGALAVGGRHILDIGTGTGVLALLMAQRFPEAKVEAVEIDDDAIIDASQNFSESKFADRITLHHLSFQDFLKLNRGEKECGNQQDTNASNETESNTFEKFDSIICNPPYFHKSMECPDERRLRARHTSSLPFEVLIGGAYELLEEGGVFSVCIPLEVYSIFCEECLKQGFSLQDLYCIKSIPDQPVKRYVLVHRKGAPVTLNRYDYCMRDADRNVSDWYKELMKDYLR